MPVSRLDHVDIAVCDLESYLRFLEKLGFQEVRRSGHYGGSVEMKLPQDSVIFELHETSMTENPGINHLAFSVEHSQDVVEELKTKGVSFEREARYVQTTNRYTSNLRNPDGFRFQLTEWGVLT